VIKEHLDGHEAPAHGTPLEEGLELVASLADCHALFALRLWSVGHPNVPSLMPLATHVMLELPDVQAPAAPPVPGPDWLVYPHWEDPVPVPPATPSVPPVPPVAFLVLAVVSPPADVEMAVL
tara:strand:+ start:112 stop:477 length:366 start_codon:yes stop_codon:yes gene_type:complete